ncbi:MAG: hypothetical protein ACR2GY_11665 [Phycisphaerales bacterium]
MKFLLTTAMTAFIATAAYAGPIELLNQVYDDQDGFASNDNGFSQEGPSRAADDVMSTGWTNLTISFYLAQRSELFADFYFEIYADNGGRPADDVALTMNGAWTAEDTGESLGGGPVFLVTFVLDPSFVLDAGRWWLSPVGVGDGTSDNITSNWATADNGNLNGTFTGHFRSEFFGFPDWTPTTDIDGFERNTNFAMNIMGNEIPAPGALALLGAAGLVARRRRRA